MKRRLGALLCAITLLLTMTPLSGAASAASTEKKLVAFTFDDGPSVHTATLLDGLKERGAHATFFMTGVNGSSCGIVNRKSVLPRMWEEGHQLANHTYSHNIKIAKIADATIRKEVTSVEDLLFQTAGGRYQDMVRTPGGARGDKLTANVPAPIILWSVDTLDWKSRNADSVYNKIIANVTDGSIVLLHDLYPTSISGALRAIDTLQKQGYECVTVAELMRRRGMTPVNGQFYTKVSKNGTDLPAYSAPTISVAYNTENGVECKVSSVDSGLTYYYTTDGSMPTLASRKYKDFITLEKSATLKVCGIDAYGTRTPLATKWISADSAAAPTFNDTNGYVKLTSDTPDARIYFTTDGTIPSESHGRLYIGPFMAKDTVKAVAVKSGLYNSRVVTGSATAYGNIYTDVMPEDWCYESIGEIVHQGLMNGTAPCRFEPNGPLTRAAAVTILYRLAGSPAVEITHHFKDVASDAWCADAVSWALQNGMVSADSKGNFRPSEHVDRQTFALLLYRYAKSQKGGIGILPEPTQFTDWANVADTAKQAFAWCNQNGIITGTSATTLSPLTKLTRAQCAVILLRFEKLK